MEAPEAELTKFGLWRPQERLCARITLADLLKSNSVIILSCQSCGARRILLKDELEKFDYKHRSLKSFEDEAVCQKCNSQTERAYLAPTFSKRFWRRFSAAPPIPISRAASYPLAAVLLLNAMAMIFISRLGKLFPSTYFSSLSETVHTALHHLTAPLFLLVSNSSQTPVIGLDSYLPEMAAFTILALISILRRKDFTVIDQSIAGERIGSTNSVQILTPERWITGHFFVQFCVAVTAISVYAIVYDSRLLQAACVIAVFFYPRRRTVRYGDKKEPISRFLLNSLGPLIFLHTVVLTTAWAVLEFLFL